MNHVSFSPKEQNLDQQSSVRKLEKRMEAEGRAGSRHARRSPHAQAYEHMALIASGFVDLYSGLAPMQHNPTSGSHVRKTCTVGQGPSSWLRQGEHCIDRMTSSLLGSVADRVAMFRVWECMQNRVDRIAACARERLEGLWRSVGYRYPPRYISRVFGVSQHARLADQGSSAPGLVGRFRYKQGLRTQRCSQL